MDKKDITRFAITAIAGAVPLAGGLGGAFSQEWGRRDQEQWNKVAEEWMRLHEAEAEEISETLAEVMTRLDMADEKVRERARSSEYHSILRRCFRNWNGAESEEKRRVLKNILSNAAGTRLASDDVVKLFLDWVGKYSEVHFKVIGVIYEKQYITRGGIWAAIHGGRVREDSAEADLFKWVMYELSVGHIIRQDRETDGQGRFVRSRQRKPQGRTMVSAFDEGKPYVLTELGKQFVHYGMTDMVKKIEGPRQSD